MRELIVQSPLELETKPITLLPTEENRSAEEIRQSLVTLPKGSVTFSQKL